MARFDSYLNTPSSYVPNNKDTVLESVNDIIKYPTEEYNAKGELVGYSWNYGDSIILEFLTEGIVLYDNGTYEDAETYLGGKQLCFKLFDSKYNVAYEETIDANISAKFLLDNSIKGLRGGNIYYCKLELIDSNNNVKQTLINVSDCKLIIK